jgi:hypothetical protein
MLTLGRMQPGELITIVAGSPPSTVGSTNAMRVHRLGTKIPRPVQDDGAPRRRWDDPLTGP